MIASDAIMIQAVCAGNKIAAVVCDRPSEHLSLDYKIDGYEGFIRFEAMDGTGHCAYSNPIYLGYDNES